MARRWGWSCNEVFVCLDVLSKEQETRLTLQEHDDDDGCVK